jgi:hypothetical protein
MSLYQFLLHLHLRYCHFPVRRRIRNHRHLHQDLHQKAIYLLHQHFLALMLLCLLDFVVRESMNLLHLHQNHHFFAVLVMDYRNHRHHLLLILEM